MHFCVNRWHTCIQRKPKVERYCTTVPTFAAAISKVRIGSARTPTPTPASALAPTPAPAAANRLSPRSSYAPCKKDPVYRSTAECSCYIRKHKTPKKGAQYRNLLETPIYKSCFFFLSLPVTITTDTHRQTKKNWGMPGTGSASPVLKGVL